MEKSGRGKNLKRALAVSLLSLMLILVFTPVTFGAWSQIGVSGNWDNSDTPALLSYDGWQDGTWAQVNFTYGNVGALAVGEGLQLWFNYTIKGEREWWWWEGTKRVAVVSALRNGSEWAYNWFYLAHEQGIAITTSEILVGKAGVCSVGKPMIGIAPNTEYYIPTWFNGFQIGETVALEGRVGLQIQRYNDTHAKVSYGFPHYLNYQGEQHFLGFVVFYEYSEPVSSDFWTNPELWLYVGHEGNGEFTLEFDDPILGSIDEFEVNEYAGEKPPQNPFQWVTDAFDFVIEMVGAFASFLTAIAPYLGMILAFYLVDAGIKCVHTRSFSPMGYVFGTLYEWTMTAYETVVHIGELIWDVITFWT